MDHTAASAGRQPGPLLTITVSEAGGSLLPRFAVSGAIPSEALVLGRSTAEAAETLPRLFNLCRAAQEAALRLALGLPPVPDSAARLRAEILRDHVLHLCFLLPARLGLAANPVPPGWAGDPDATANALFGPARRLPGDPAGFAGWLAEGQGAAPVLAAIATAFAPGEATSATLPLADGGLAAACENSVAARQSAHPLIRGIEERHGRGPLWRATARLADAEACLAGTLPAPQTRGPGRATAPSARGLYSVCATTRSGVVTALGRRTPTDDMIAPDGPLETAIAALPPAKSRFLPLLVQLFDPCMGTRIEATDA